MDSHDLLRKQILERVPMYRQGPEPRPEPAKSSATKRPAEENPAKGQSMASLLEKSLQNRSSVDSKQDSAMQKVRDKAILESDMSLIGKLLK